MQYARTAKPLPLPAAPTDWALFLDVDGTIAEIERHPDDVVVSPDIIAVLECLYERTGGAVAIVSGRPLDQIDALLSPLVLPAAGLHGLERRTDPGGAREDAAVPAWISTVARQLDDFVAGHDGAWVENKGATLALHYRGHPELEDAATAFAERIAARHGEGLTLQTGKMIVEFRPRGDDKGDVVDFFMRLVPYADRTPVFVGDDVTDERGFAAVRAYDGIGIHVGGRDDTAAEWRLSGVDDVRQWLRAVAAALLPSSGKTDP